MKTITSLVMIKKKRNLTKDKAMNLTKNYIKL